MRRGDGASEQRMSKIYKTAAAIAVSAVTLIAMIGSGAATSAQQRAGYCLLYNYGRSDCSFTSKAQCEETAFGLGAECYRDVSIGYGRVLWMTGLLLRGNRLERLKA